MKILITGNMGYIGPVLVKHLRKLYPQVFIAGLDTGFFANQLTESVLFPERLVNVQYFYDVRSFPENILEGFDSVVYLSAVSNDPMGNKFENPTMEINYRSCIKTAKSAKKFGVKKFVFASSCSTYGFADDTPRTEQSATSPLTAYAKSKVYAENELKDIASKDFTITCLRFATACGMSPRLRLDLVLNDFVASAIVNHNITILSDGTPWRPLINVNDMSRAIDWAIAREKESGNFLIVNAGSNAWNYQVKELAQAVAAIIPGTDVSINKDAQPDKRSYKVNFDLFKSLAPKHQPEYDLERTILELRTGLEAIGFKEKEFRNTYFMRLKILERLMQDDVLDNNLYWKKSNK